MLLVRAIVAFLAMPTVVGLVVPWLLVRIDSWRGGGCSMGASLVALGAAGLLWCVRDFYVVGRGTLAPWSPPRPLVAVGLCRVMRNPMYVSVLALVAGIGLSRGDGAAVSRAGSRPDLWWPVPSRVLEWSPR
jgi:protein-S-isoprenylcysteine O-methyltransferase Ste14